MTAALPNPVTSCAAIGDDAFGLTRIFDPAIQLAVWRRTPDPTIGNWLERNAGALGCGFRQLITPGQTPVLDTLPTGSGRDALADDLAQLAEMLAELLDAPAIGVRLEVIHKAMCPRLHVDRVGVRMLCTYRGPGTEWVEEQSIDRSRLGAASAGLADTHSGVLRPDHCIESIPLYAAALLKGSLWQDNTGRGIVHRSPAVSSPPRVLAAFDAAW